MTAWNKEIINCLKADTAHQMHLLKEKFNNSFADFLKICLKLKPNLDGKLVSDSTLAPEVLIASCLPCYLLS